MAKDDKSICTSCGYELSPTEYYLSRSILHKLTNKHSVCKDCMVKIYDDYLKEVNDIREATYYTCRKLDVCFNDNVFNGSISQSNKPNIKTPFFKIYMQKINSATNNKAGIDFDYSSNIFTDENEEYYETMGIEDKNTNMELENRWGGGFTGSELQYLESLYHEWDTHSDLSKLAVQKLVRMICIKDVEIRKARVKNLPTDKLEKSMLELMTNSNLTPKTMSAVNESDSTKVYGAWIKDIEKYKPAEYFKDKKLYHDMDGIYDYFDRFVLRPMKNLMTNTKIYDKEFMIEDDDAKVGDSTDE